MAFSNGVTMNKTQKYLNIKNIYHPLIPVYAALNQKIFCLVSNKYLNSLNKIIETVCCLQNILNRKFISLNQFLFLICNVIFEHIVHC